LPHGVAWTYLSEVALPDATASPEHPLRVSFVFNERKNPLVILDVLQQTRIVPKHVVEPMFAAPNNEPKEI
jgi:hypothetical protein